MRPLQSCDTDIISSSQSSLLSTPESVSSVRNQAWPERFPVPQFSFDAEIQLQKAQLAYQTDGTVLSPNAKLKSDILDDNFRNNKGQGIPYKCRS